MRQEASVIDDPWGARARDWAEIEDEGSRPLFEEVLGLTKVGAGSRYLDVGCGSGLACAMARARGAHVGGLDASPGLLAIASRLPGGLSPREGQVISRVAQGRTNRQIATELQISEHTVARHLSNIFAKLDLNSRAAAAAYAMESGLVAREPTTKN